MSLIELLQKVDEFEEKFEYYEDSMTIPLKQLSTTSEFINWSANLQDKLVKYVGDSTAQEILTILENFNAVDETTNYHLLRAKIHIFIEHSKKNGYPRSEKSLEIPSVFVSYNEVSGKTFVDDLKKQVMDKCKLCIYSDNLNAWEALSTFMKTIRKNDFAVIVITDQYLKSEACLYEVTELMRDDDWIKKTMFSVLDSSIYDPDNHIKYIQYWSEKANELNKKINSLPNSASAEQSNRLKQLRNVVDNIGTFLKTVSDVKNPSQYTAISEILKRIAVITDE